MEVAILIGLQASGKTSFHRALLAATHEHLSKDNFPRARHRQRRQLRLLAEALAAGRSVAVDNTSPSPQEWQPVIAVARAYQARVVGYWFPPDLSASLERNAARSGRARVPEVGLRATAARLHRPRLADGFDELFSVHFDGAGGFTVQCLRES